MNYEFFGAASEIAKNQGWLNISPAWLALFGAIFGGAGLKLVEPLINKPSRRDSTPAELREELRLQIEGLKADVIHQQKEIDTTEAEMLVWREKYWSLVAEHNKAHRRMLDYLSELAQLREQIQERE